MPADKKQTTVIRENKDGSIVIQYQPTEQGRHEMAVSFNDQPVAGKQTHSIGLHGRMILNHFDPKVFWNIFSTLFKIAFNFFSENVLHKYKCYGKRYKQSFELHGW